MNAPRIPAHHTTLTTDINAPGGIRTRISSKKRAVAKPRLRPCSHWEQQMWEVTLGNVEMTMYLIKYPLMKTYEKVEV